MVKRNMVSFKRRQQQQHYPRAYTYYTYNTRNNNITYAARVVYLCVYIYNINILYTYINIYTGTVGW